jgi:hypothetical protein
MSLSVSSIRFFSGDVDGFISLLFKQIFKQMDSSDSLFVQSRQGIGSDAVKKHAQQNR